MKTQAVIKVLRVINFELDKLSSGMLNNQRRHDFDRNNKDTKINRNKAKKNSKIQSLTLNIFRCFTGLVYSFAVLFVSHKSSSPVGISTWRKTCKELEQ